MKPAPFAYVRADSVEEACEVLYREGENARILAGGQSLGAMLNMRIATPSVLVDINRIASLDRIEAADLFVRMGATVRQAGALKDPAITRQIPLLAAALPHVGHYQTRGRGTLAGSVAHADPSAEIPLVLTVLDGFVELASRRKRRRIPAREFFVSALTTKRAPEEMVVALHWPPALPGAYYGFREYALRAGDYAIAAAACFVQPPNAGNPGLITIGFAGCAGRPQVLEQSFSDDEAGPALILALAAEATDKIECKGDLHASADYRRQLVRLLCKELAGEAFKFFERSAENVEAGS